MYRYLGQCLGVLVMVMGVSVGAQTDTPRLLSAYFGLDNALPRTVNRICRGGANMDGMPVIFSAPVDVATLQPQDFAVITAGGTVNTPRCVTLGPAADVGELRTALLIGELGDAENDPPVRVEIVGEILSGSGDPGAPALLNPADALDFMGASVDVTPLVDGPTLILAEVVPPTDWVLDVEGQQGQGSGCPNAGTVQIIRTTWGGGITKPGGAEVDDREREQYRLIIADDTQTPREVTPFALADLDDGDNHHLLCIDVAGTPLSVQFAAGYLTDPNEDALNPETAVDVLASPAE